ncbi:hypothetical protein [Sporosarcina pasteurii]|uniref:Histidine kinase n=2 Tax=Sporosarcina TaxID=1569 RepID=A0A380CL24_SPOPA|nr:hypothetical protein BI350_01930 [Sporosarcina ureilytica]SUJ21642.1 Uncharacterised protein [Sporosarcina pasteurii]
MRIFKFVIPIMLIVAWASWAILNRNHTDVPEETRIYITIGAVIVSGIISYFLFPKNEEER